MYFGECAVSNQIDLVLYENDNIINILDTIFNEGTEVVNEVSLKDIGKSVWDAIKRIFRTLKTAFENLLLNVNYFKNAEMDEQYNQDLLHVLKEITLKTLDFGSGFLPAFFRFMATYRKDSADKEFSTIYLFNRTMAPSDFEYEITKHVADINDSLQSGKDTDEYRRIEANEYKNEKMTKVPLTHIIPDMKDSNTKLTKFINELDKQQNFNDKISEEDTEIKSLSGKMITYLRKLIEYFKFRISLLQNYFKTAKASLDAVKNNIKEVGKKDNVSREKLDGLLKSGKVKNVVVNDLAALKECQDNLTDYNKELDFAKYKEEYKKFASMLKCSPNDGIIIVNKDQATKVVSYLAIRNHYERVNVKSRKLYHYAAKVLEGSDIDQSILSEGLRPNALGDKSGFLHTTMYYPEPRVYIHVSVPGTYAGSVKPVKFRDKDDGILKGTLYEIQGNYDVYRDPEYKGTAAFILSDTPVKCKRISYEDWLKDNEVEDANKKPKEEKEKKEE